MTESAAAVKRDPRKIIMTLYNGDGVGTQAEDEFNFLPKAALKAINLIREQVHDLGIEIKTVWEDLSTKHRLGKDTPGSIRDHHEGVASRSMDRGGFIIKFPGRTLKDGQIIQFLESECGKDLGGIEYNGENGIRSYTSLNNFPYDLLAEFNLTRLNKEQRRILTHIHKENDALSPSEVLNVYKGWRTSPNALLRQFLGLGTIYRPLDPVKGGYRKPQVGTMDLFDPTLDDENWSELSGYFTETGEDGECVRCIRTEKLEAYTNQLVAEAKSKGKTIYLASKDTISDFDATFTQAVKDKARSAGVEVYEALFDAFLERATNQDWSEYLIATLPGNTAMIKPLSELKSADVDHIDEKEVGAKLSTRHFFRVPIGSGYSENMALPDGQITETYTLPLEEIQSSARAAARCAKQQTNPEQQKVVMVLPQSEGPAAARFQSLCEDVCRQEGVEFEAWSFGEFMVNLTTKPNAKECVFVGDNVMGDYASDFNAGNMLNGLKAGKSLGIPPSIDYAFDRNGKLIVTLANPAAGTAEALAKGPEESKKVLSANVLKSIAVAISNHPFFDEDQDPQGTAAGRMQAIGNLLSQAVDEVTRWHIDRDSHESFADDVVDQFRSLAKVIDNTKRGVHYHLGAAAAV